MALLSRWRIWKVLTFSFLIATVAASGQQVLPSVKTVARSYAQMPLVFERNEGQTDNRVKYLSRGTGYSLFLTPSEAVFALRKSVPHDTLKPRHVKNVEGATAVVRMQLVGGNPDANEAALQRLSGTSNYFVGNDRSRWYSGVENYGKVGFNGVYPGIDVVYYGNQKRLEYDFLVHPKAKPSLIRLKFAGVKRVKVLKSGALLLELGSGFLQWKAPIAYQERQGRHEQVAVKYVLKGTTEVSFTAGIYDHARPLVIDPELVYSTFLGGNGEDFGDDITVDKEGSAYITGHTFSSTFPTTQGAFQLKRSGRTDAFVTKLSADGASLIYSTFLGGKEEETATGIVVDKVGNAYISGYTNSVNFPTTQGAFQSKYQGYYDAFVTKLSADGKSLLYSTYLGGAKRDDIATKIAVDANGFAFVAGASFSADFPTTSGAFQSVHRGLQSAFVAKFSLDGKSLVYSTLLGGKDSSAGSGVVVDREGNAYISGYTNGYDFPTTPGAFQITKGLGYDAFVAKLNSDGKSLLYSTFLGGQEDDTAAGIALDAEGRAAVVGSTRSPDFPVTQRAFQSVSGGSYDAFVTKLSADGASLVYSTYIGGTQQDVATGIVLDSIGNAFITGSTHSPEFPTTQGAFQIINRGYFDAFATKLSADGTRLLNSTYLGGKADETGKSVAVDSVGSAYITGYTFSSNFPFTPGAYQTSYKVWAEAMCTKLSMADVSGKADTRISTHSGEVPLSESITLYARLSRTVDGAGLVAKPLTFKLDGVALDVKYTINNGGVAFLLYKVDLSATLGKHILTVDFAGDGNNKPSSGKAAITFTKANTSINLSDASGYYGEQLLLRATLQNSLGVPLAGKTIVFTADGSPIASAETDGNGYAALSYALQDTLSVDGHALKAEFSGDDRHKASSSNAAILFARKTYAGISLNSAIGQVGGTANIKAKIIRYTDKAGLSGRTLVLKLAGAQIGTVVTDSAGGIEFSYKIDESLGVGAFALSAEFAGDSQYFAAVSRSRTLTISPSPTKMSGKSVSGKPNSVVTLSTTLIRSTDKAGVKGRQVRFQIEGVDVGTGVTDERGLVTTVYTIPATISVGRHTITTVFDGDALYTQSSNSKSTLTVN